MNWRHKDVWTRDGTNFIVQVSRHSVEKVAEYDSTGPHRWCVYAYIYPEHHEFASFKGPDMWQDAATDLPLHGGPSMLRWHYNTSGEPTSVQVGADYNHLHDEDFTHMATDDDARKVFADADKLHSALSAKEAA